MPRLERHLPDTYLDHFTCLVKASFLLLKKITVRDLNGWKSHLDVFVNKCMAPLYGEETCVLDVHNLSHMVECGKLGTFVGLLIFFSFQSFNGEILKAIHGKGHVSGKVYWAVHSEKQILKIKSNCFRMEKLKISWKKLTSRNTLKN